MDDKTRDLHVIVAMLRAEYPEESDSDIVSRFAAYSNTLYGCLHQTLDLSKAFKENGSV
ncbi:hypothetical protein AGMMS49992_27000 [Clostridia bacterium]|nr:hypothetical protein AGMMS49992_27000 [Clostridia bacterium]